MLDGAAGAFLQGVDAVVADRQQAGIRGVVAQAVLLLSEAQIGDGEQVVQHVDEALGRRYLPGLYGHQNALHLFDARAQIPGSHPLLGNPQAHIQPLDRAHRLPQQGTEALDAGLVQIDVGNGIGPLGEARQHRRHKTRICAINVGVLLPQGGCGP